MGSTHPGERNRPMNGTNFSWPQCELCGEPVDSLGLGLYTSKRKRRRFCSRDCRNTANSRTGNEVRTKKLMQRIEAGDWQNPAALNPPNPVNISKGVRRVRRQEVAKGRWRNPALTPEARKKLSRPRKHKGVLHNAIEKLKQGLKMDDLTAEEAESYRTYRRKIYADNRTEYQRKWRESYRKRKKK